MVSSFSLRKEARRFSSRNSAPGDVARTRGTPAPAPLELALALDLAFAAKLRLLADLGVRRGRVCASEADDDDGDKRELEEVPSLPALTLWKTKSVNRRFF